MKQTTAFLITTVCSRALTVRTITVPALLDFPGNPCGNFSSSRYATASALAACNGNKDDDVWFKFIDQQPSTTVRVYGSGGYVPRVQVLDSVLASLSPVHCDVGA